MSTIFEVKPHDCHECPFFDSYEAIDSRSCNLNRELEITNDMIHHPSCPLLDGRTVIVKIEDGKLLVGEGYR